MGDNGSMQVSLSSNFPALSPNDSSAPTPDGERLNTLIEEAIAAYSPVPPQASADSASMRQTLMQLLSWAHSLEQVAARTVERVQILGTGMRSVVVRVAYEPAAESAEFLPTSIIVKRYCRKDSTVNAGGFGYLRERYGLEALNRQVPGLFPQLYGADPELRVLALEDVSAGTVEGEQYSVTHALLEGTEQQALDALNYYIEAYHSLAASGIMGEAVEDYRLNLARADRKAQFPGAIASPGLAERGLKKLYGVADEARTPEHDTDSPASSSAAHEDAPVLPAAVEELSFRFRRVLQPFFTKRPPVPEQFKLNRGRVYMLWAIFRRRTCWLVRRTARRCAWSMRRAPACTTAASPSLRRCWVSPPRRSTRATGWTVRRRCRRCTLPSLRMPRWMSTWRRIWRCARR